MNSVPKNLSTNVGIMLVQDKDSNPVKVVITYNNIVLDRYVRIISQ